MNAKNAGCSILVVIARPAGPRQSSFYPFNARIKTRYESRATRYAAGGRLWGFFNVKIKVENAKLRKASPWLYHLLLHTKYDSRATRYEIRTTNNEFNRG
jgi:hypothetical protein